MKWSSLFRAGVALAAFAVTASASAQVTPKPGTLSYKPSGTINGASVLITGSATALLAASTYPRWHLHITNVSADKVYCSFTTATPTVAGAGTFLLDGLGSNRGFSTGVPTNAIYCISAGSSSRVNVEYGQ